MTPSPTDKLRDLQKTSDVQLREEWRELCIRLEVSPVYSENLFNWFTAALQKERTRLMELLPREAEPTLCANCNFQGDLCTRCYGNRQRNTCLREVRERLFAVDVDGAK